MVARIFKQTGASSAKTERRFEAGNGTERESLRWLANELTLRTHQVAAIVVPPHQRPEQRETVRTLAVESGIDVYTLSSSPSSDLAELPTAHFDRVYVFLVLAAVFDRELQCQLHRIVRAQGEIVIVARSEDFSFAPLPLGGDFHVLKRTLAGTFDSVRLEHRSADFIAISAVKVGSR
jgi:hypothetical protein